MPDPGLRECGRLHCIQAIIARLAIMVAVPNPLAPVTMPCLRKSHKLPNNKLKQPLASKRVSICSPFPTSSLGLWESNREADTTGSQAPAVRPRRPESLNGFLDHEDI